MQEPVPFRHFLGIEPPGLKVRHAAQAVSVLPAEPAVHQTALYAEEHAPEEAGSSVGGYLTRYNDLFASISTAVL